MTDDRLSERMAVVENRLDQQDDRMNRQGDRIEKLQADNIKQDAKLSKLCRDQEKNNEMTADIHGIVKTIKWLFCGAASVLGLYLTLKQLGWF